ncbi:hypothetical protein M0802_007553 [Mischocyttarus mexicanus]|nr:hypothetical protein M0802_007553 [Mischocyttarus mexicanus]
MSKSQNRNTKDSIMVKILSSRNSNNNSKSSLKQTCVSTNNEEIKEGKSKLLVKKDNLNTNDLILINIGGKQHKMRKILLNKSIKDKIIVTVENEKFILLTKKSNKIRKENPDSDKNLNTEYKDGQSFTSNEFQGLSVVENVPKNIPHNRVFNENEYKQLLESDTAICLQEMNEIINYLLVGFNIRLADKKTIIKFLDDLIIKMIKVNNSIKDKVVMMKNELLKQINSTISKQIKNKKRTFMGYPRLLMSITNKTLMNNIIEKEILENNYNLFTQSEETQSFEESQPLMENDTGQILLSKKDKTNQLMIEVEFDNPTSDLMDMEIDNYERAKFITDLFQFMSLRGTPIETLPRINSKQLDIFLLYKLVIACGGFVEVTRLKLWPAIYKTIYKKSNEMKKDMRDYTQKLCQYLLFYYYRVYLYNYELKKESFPIPPWLLPADTIHRSNIQKRTLFKRQNSLNCEKSKHSSKLIQYLVQYLRANNSPDPDLFPKSITYILQKTCYTAESSSPILTDGISKPSTNQSEISSYLERQFEQLQSETETQTETEQDFLSETILPTEHISKTSTSQSKIAAYSERRSEDLQSYMEINHNCSPKNKHLTDKTSKTSTSWSEISSYSEHSSYSEQLQSEMRVDRNYLSEKTLSIDQLSKTSTSQSESSSHSVHQSEELQSDMEIDHECSSKNILLTDQISKTSTNQSESSSYSVRQSEELQSDMEIDHDCSSKNILLTEVLKINEKSESIIESTKDYPLKTTSELTPEPEHELRPETKSEVNPATYGLLEKVDERKVTDIESMSPMRSSTVTSQDQSFSNTNVSTTRKPLQEHDASNVLVLGMEINGVRYQGVLLPQKECKRK